MISIMARNMALIFVQKLELKNAQRDRVCTLTRRWTRYGDNGGGDSRWRRRSLAAGGGWWWWGRSEDQEGWQSWVGAVGGLKEFPKFNLRIYIYPIIVGVTEWNHLVAPRWRIASGYCNSVRPNYSNRLHWGETLDQLNDFSETERNESVRPKAIKRFWKFKPLTDWWLWVLLTWRVRIWLDQTLWCSMNRVWDKKSINS